MQFEFLFGPKRRRDAAEDWLQVGGSTVRLRLVRNRRARRYILRLGRDGTARVTIPRGGSTAEGTRFARRNLRWLEQQLLLYAKRPRHPNAWTAGMQILFRGEAVRVQARQEGEVLLVSLAEELSFQIRNPRAEALDLRPQIERQLWKLAARELPPRVMELAALHQLPARRVTVRNQRSRWGSCSRRGTISLNWRLVQAPVFVRDYIILHELAHLKEMNHSDRFWREVERLCPNFRPAEQWLKRHSAAGLELEQS